ncbi:MAG: hypothetical protein JST95_06355 [Bacteroidetes bacterium]|nr:hypothetical protein [Bacteroidota bacterium]
MIIKNASFCFVLVFIILTTFSSCKKNTLSEQINKALETNQLYSRSSSNELTLQTPFLSFSTLLSVAENLKDKEGKFLEDPNIIEYALAPLIENGKILHNELVYNVTESKEWDSLSDEERNSIVYVNNIQLAQLSFIYTISNPDLEQQALKEGISVDIIKDCVGVALGLAGIKHLATTLVTAPTVSTAIGILKWVGKRYLSYLGVAWMVWDFIDCISHF